jgi:hypothetical protein
MVARAEIIVITLNLCGPIVPKGPFDTAAHRPARSRNTGFDMFVKGR